jgi:hypothetical protein
VIRIAQTRRRSDQRALPGLPPDDNMEKAPVPGFTVTKRNLARFGDEARQMVRERMPSGRLSTSEDVASAVVYLGARPTATSQGRTSWSPLERTDVGRAQVCMALAAPSRIDRGTAVSRTIEGRSLERVGDALRRGAREALPGDRRRDQPRRPAHA